MQGRRAIATCRDESRQDENYAGDRAPDSWVDVSHAVAKAVEFQLRRISFLSQNRLLV